MKALNKIVSIEVVPGQPEHNPGAYSAADQEMVAEFDIQMLLPIGMTVVVFAIGIAYGLSVMEDVEDDVADCGDNASYIYDDDTNLCVYNTTLNASPVNSAYNASLDGVDAVAKFPEKLGLIVTVVIAAIVIGILVRYLFVRYG